MATTFKPPSERHTTFDARPQREVDREQLRVLIRERYKNTLAYLGR